MSHAPNYWLFKTEPSSYSIDDLERDGSTFWDGIRNYQVRNFMRDDMSVGDRVLLYHSNASPPAVVGTAEVSSTAYPDHTQFDAGHEKFDPASDTDNPRWLMVDIRFSSRFERAIPLNTLRGTPGLETMGLLRKGNRLSVQPVTEEEFETVLSLTR